MNPAIDPPPTSRASTSCTRHPEDSFTGFCPSCLCERLAVLDHSSARKPPSSAAALKALFKPSHHRSNGAYFPELRRSKSFSAARNEALSFEPQRRSCDVRARSNTASFNKSREEIEEPEPEIEIEIEDEARIELEDEIRGRDEVNSSEAREIVEEVKEYIELDSQSKKPSSIVGSFWTAASVLSKKLQKWRKAQKLKRARNGVGSATLPVEKPIGRQFRETQSEIADYGFGRRSCDTDPRFSLDDRRISFDDARCSLDELRASWDGHLVGRSFSKLAPMLSVVEAPQVSRSDSQIPTEEPPVPGGSAQTREYYDSSRRRKSFERSASFRKTVNAGEDSKPSTAKVSPATTTIECKLQIPDSMSNLDRNCSEAFEMAFRDHHHNGSSFVGNRVRQGSIKKSRRWGKGWSIWGFINRRGGGGDEEDGFSRVRVNVNGGVVQRSLSESWRCPGGERKVCRSNSSVSFRNSNSSLERNRSGWWESPGNVESGMLRFYLTPLQGSRRNGNSRTGHAQSIARSVLRLY